MQATDRVLAWRYGRALFLAAAAKGEEAKVQADLASAQGAILGCLAVLKHPQVSVADKKRTLKDALEGKVSPLTMRFLDLLIDKKRFDILPFVASDLGKLINDKNNVAKAQVRSAQKLSAADQEGLRERLSKFSGKKIELDINEDPEILGGVVVRLGDWVLDGSLRGQLRIMREAINGH